MAKPIGLVIKIDEKKRGKDVQKSIQAETLIPVQLVNIMIVVIIDHNEQ